jgi:hypothetical protein
LQFWLQTGTPLFQGAEKVSHHGSPGAIADGGSGAWKGAAIGAGVGAAATLLTKGKDVEFPAEQLFSFTLSQEVKIVR